MDNVNIYLPSLTVDELNRLVDDATVAKDAKLNKIVKNAYDLIYDEAYEYNQLIKRSNSNLGEIFKTLSVRGQAISEDGTKIKANATTLSALLTQTTFGKTGMILRLPHSGFSVKLKVITASMRSDLQYNIANSIIQLDRVFSGDLYTAVFVEITDTVMRFFLDLVDYATVDYRKKDDLLKLIKLKDLNLIMLSIAKLIYPEGYEDFSYVCGETIKDEDGASRICADTLDVGLVDLDEFIYYTHEFSEDELKQLMKNEKNSISVLQVEKYQNSFKHNEPAQVTIDDLTFTIDGGSIKNHIDKSKEWLELSVVNNDSFDKEDIEIIAELIQVSSLGKYYYALSKVENDSYVSNDITVEHINILSSNPAVAEAVIKVAKASLASSAYVIGVPKYTCSSCYSNQKPELDENGNPKPKEETIISNINVIDLFTYLV